MALAGSFGAAQDGLFGSAQDDKFEVGDNERWKQILRLRRRMTSKGRQRARTKVRALVYLLALLSGLKPRPTVTWSSSKHNAGVLRFAQG
jgi:hypothetical protein